MSWEDNANKLSQAVGHKLREIEYRADRVVKSRDSRQNRYLSLRALIDEATKLCGPYIPCRKGCSYCCYMAVPISRFEAEILSKATGRQVANLSYAPSNVDPGDAVRRITENAASKFINKPCSFLDYEGLCSVYEHRPMNCRSHVVVSEVEFCDLSSGLIECQQVDLNWASRHTTELFMHHQIADIREWFPDA